MHLHCDPGLAGTWGLEGGSRWRSFKFPPLKWDDCNGLLCLFRCCELIVVLIESSTTFEAKGTKNLVDRIFSADSLKIWILFLLKGNGSDWNATADPEARHFNYLQGRFIFRKLQLRNRYATRYMLPPKSRIEVYYDGTIRFLGGHRDRYPVITKPQLLLLLAEAVSPPIRRPQRVSLGYYSFHL